MKLPKRCVKCRESAVDLLYWALLDWAGAKVSPGPMDCRKGGEHVFYYKRDRLGRFARA